jgi:preprotein translocase subunit SecF
MEFFKKTTNIDFMRARWWTAVISALLLLGSCLTLAINGLHLGLDFTGGVQVEANYPVPADLNKIRRELSQAGFNESEVKTYGSVRDVLITLPTPKSSANTINNTDQQTQLQDKIAQALPGAQIQQFSVVGAEVGKELFTKGSLALFVSLLAILIYISFRFEYRFAISAILALIHDPVLILGMFSLFHIQFDLIAFAAVLTVIGYSLNDTIVVFDRVRENFRKVRKGTPLEIMNLSINQTLSRTIMTSGLTLLAVIALLIYGGPVLFGFSLALLIGIIIGTYSSIYVAGALAIAFGLQRADFLPKQKAALQDDLP